MVRGLKSSCHLSWECDFHTSTEMYAKRFDGKAGEMILNRQSGLLFSFLGNIEGKKVLDVGAGHGQSAEVVLSKGGHLTAYGSGENSFYQLNKIIREKGYSVKFKVGKLYKLPFEEKAFDVAISLRMISHLPDWTVFLKELCRVAKESVIVDFAPGSSLKLFSFFLKKRTEVASRQFTTQSVDEIRRVAAGSGFISRNFERQFIIPLCFHRMLKGTLLLPLERMAQKFHLTRFVGGPVLAVFDRMEE